jgi:hypothetical protein
MTTETTTVDPATIKIGGSLDVEKVQQLATQWRAARCAEAACCPPCAGSRDAYEAAEQKIEDARGAIVEALNDDPILGWAATDPGADLSAVLGVAKLAPCTLADVYAHADRAGWCSGFERVIGRAAAAGVLPAGLPPRDSVRCNCGIEGCTG